MNPGQLRSTATLQALLIISSTLMFAPPVAAASNSYTAPTAITSSELASTADIARAGPISDVLLRDCLAKIGEFAEPTRSDVSSTPSFDEMSRIKTDLYYEYADLSGFLYALDNAALNDPEGITTLSIPVQGDLSPAFDDAWAEVVREAGGSHIRLEKREGSGSVREVCAVFLDVLESTDLSAHIEGAAIDQRANRVVIFARDSDFVGAYAQRAYGDLAQIEATDGAVEESRDWSTGPFAAGHRMYVPGGGSAWCSQGFNMRNANGTPFTTTAAHCGAVGQQWHSAGYIGAITNHLPGRDVAFVFGGSYINQMYRGTWNSNSTGTVLGALSGLPNPGNYAGYSEATTGESSARYAYSGCQGGYCNLLFFDGHTTSGGDSGGPWFAQVGSSADTYAVAIHRGYLSYPANKMMATDVRYVLSATWSTVL